MVKYNISEYLKNALVTCKTPDQIDYIFDEVKIIKIDMKKDILLQIMKDPEISYTNTSSEIQEYELIKELFLNKEWMNVGEFK